MRIYYIGQLWQGGTCRERMLALEGMGHELVPFDTTPWVSGGGRIARSVAHRFNFGPNVTSMNRAVVSHCLAVGRADLVWIDKGRWLLPETLESIREATRGVLLHYTPDPQLLLHKSRHFERCVPRYDWIVTTKPFELELYKSLKAKNIIFVLQGYDQRFIQYERGLHAGGTWSSDVCFVGHQEGHYAAYLRSAGSAGARLRIWGPGWVRYAQRNRWARAPVSGNGVWGDDYLHALANAKIALGLLSKRIPETTTTRSFEIPAIGTFLLAERTDDHLALFEEGKEAEYFADNDELQSKLRYYLKNEQARTRIAVAGRERCLRSGYASKHQLERILRQLGNATMGQA